MKKLVLAFIGIAAATISFSERLMHVQKSDGNTVSFNVENVKEVIYVPETSFLVRFYNEDSTLIKTEIVEMGKSAKMNAPVKEGKKFIGWSESIDSVVANVSVYPIYEQMWTYVGKYAYVDLGLPSGLLWSTFNVGATKQEAYGNHYSWAETSTNIVYTTSTYKYGTGPTTGRFEELTKYNTNPKYGKVDSLMTLSSTDDAATVNWGKEWRTPTEDEFIELKDNCEWTWISINGVNGYEVKASNGNWIFLSAAGNSWDRSVYHGFDGQYWTSSLDSWDSGNACCLSFDKDNHYVTTYQRFVGFSVRPVRDNSDSSK